jgi:hypothetical protein
MSLFDLIEQVAGAEKQSGRKGKSPVDNRAPGEPLPPPVITDEKATAPVRKGEPSSPDPAAGLGRSQKAETARRRAVRPEKLKFLKPCSICQGREFTHREHGGFFCNNCQPGIEGHPVIAMGHREPPETVTGLPCASCGSTTWTKEKDGYQYPDGTITDGWHCGGKHCGVKLLSGNKDADRDRDMIELAGPPWEDRRYYQAAGASTAAEKEYFLIGYAWIRDHLPELLAAGWTRAALFRRARYRWPLGPWGAAWSVAWKKQDLKVRIGGRGELIFTFSSDSRMITQRILPPNNKKKQ